MISCKNEKGSAVATESDTAEQVEISEPAAPAPSADELLGAYKGKAASDSIYTTASGLKYIVLTEGTGAAPKATDVVKVHYTGTLPDGTVFDSSVQRGEPISFPLQQVIAGWTEGLQLMKEGGKTVFYIPSDLAYGAGGAGPLIGPNQDLLFEVELIKVNPEPEMQGAPN